MNSTDNMRTGVSFPRAGIRHAMVMPKMFHGVVLLVVSGRELELSYQMVGIQSQIFFAG